jgi:hypothetical protein
MPQYQYQQAPPQYQPYYPQQAPPPQYYGAPPQYQQGGQPGYYSNRGGRGGYSHGGRRGRGGYRGVSNDIDPEMAVPRPVSDHQGQRGVRCIKHGFETTPCDYNLRAMHSERGRRGIDIGIGRVNIPVNINIGNRNERPREVVYGVPMPGAPQVDPRYSQQNVVPVADPRYLPGPAEQQWTPPIVGPGSGRTMMTEGSVITNNTGRKLVVFECSTEPCDCNGFQRTGSVNREIARMPPGSSWTTKDPDPGARYYACATVYTNNGTILPADTDIFPITTSGFEFRMRDLRAE